MSQSFKIHHTKDSDINEDLSILNNIIHTIKYDLQDIEIINNLRTETEDAFNKFYNLKAHSDFFSKDFAQIKSELEAELSIASKKFIEDERFAKENKLGLWSMKFEYPWEFRKL